MTIDNLCEQRGMSHHSKLECQKDAASMSRPRGRGQTVMRQKRFFVNSEESVEGVSRGMDGDVVSIHRRYISEEDTDAVCWNLFSSPSKTTAHAPHGYPLGRGRPEDVPEDFKDQFHSTCEDMSDLTDELYDSSDEEPDDIFSYDMEHSRFSTVSDCEKRRKRVRHRVNRQAHQDRRHQHGRGRPKKLSLPLFLRLLFRQCHNVQ